jgi:hypothetical protein
MIRAALAAGLLALSGLTLAGCGSQSEVAPSARVAQTLTASVLAGRRGARAPAAPVAPTRAQVAALPVPVLLVTVERSNTSALVVEIGENGGVETWSSVDNRTLALRGGQLLATRGLRADLVAAQVPATAQIAAGGSWDRLLTMLTGEDQAVTTRYACEGVPAGPARIVIAERAYDTRLVRESCEAGDTRFVNEYWFQGGANLRQSRQWIGQGIGHVAIRRLSD